MIMSNNFIVSIEEYADHFGNGAESDSGYDRGSEWAITNKKVIIQSE